MNQKYLKAVYTPKVIKGDAEAVDKIQERRKVETEADMAKSQIYA